MKKSAIVLAAILMAGCKTKERIVMVETTRTDTTYITRHQRDSIYVRDSTHTRESQRGDTVFVEVERLRRIYIDRTAHDTLRVATHDTIPKPYPVEVEVEKQLTRWQRIRLRLANILLCALGIGAVFGVFRLKRKLLP